MTYAHNFVLFDEGEVKGKIEPRVKNVKKMIVELEEKLEKTNTDPEKLAIWKEIKKLEKGFDVSDLLETIENSNSYEELGDPAWGFCQGWRYSGFASAFLKTFKKSKEARLLGNLLSEKANVFGVKSNEIIQGYLPTKEIQANGAGLIQLLREFDIKKNLDEIITNTDEEIGKDEKETLEYLERIRNALIEVIEKALKTKRSIVLVTL